MITMIYYMNKKLICIFVTVTRVVFCIDHANMSYSGIENVLGFSS